MILAIVTPLTLLVNYSMIEYITTDMFLPLDCPSMHRDFASTM